MSEHLLANEVAYRVLVCGGRDYRERQRLESGLEELYSVYRRNLMLIEGGAPGADFLVRQWCEAKGLPHARVDAPWSLHGRFAGPLRNSAMLLLQPHEGLAFPGGKGTADMVSKMKNAGIPVREVK